MPSTTAPARLYDVIQERAIVTIPADAAIPSPEMLEEARSALSAVWEFLIQQIVRSVVGVSNIGERNSATYEDIGHLVIWADDVRDQAEQIIEDAAKVSILARRMYDIASGFEGDGSDFDELGLPSDRTHFAQNARKHGFRVRSDA